VATSLIDDLSFLAEWQVTAMSGSLSYIRSSLWSFEAARVQEKHIDTEENLQAIHSVTHP
jgi:hypothetical protein